MTQFYHAAQQQSASPIPTSRVCTKCGVEKPLELFNKKKNGLYGKRSRCVACEVAYKREHHPYQKKPPTPPSDHKLCKKCDKRLPYPQSFYKGEAVCKACRIAHAVIRQSSPEHKARHRQEYLRNRDKRAAYYVENKSSYRTTGQAWRKANPEKARASHLRRKAHKLGAVVEPVDYKTVLDRDGYWCYICEQPIDPTAKSKSSTALTFDHVIPLQPRAG